MMFDNSVFTSEAKLNAALAGDKKAIEKIRLCWRLKISQASMMKYMRDLEQYRTQYSRGRKLVHRRYAGDESGQAIYPDANSTMRLTYGKVLNYSPKDGVIYDYVTTMDGVMQKRIPKNWEFVVPAKLKELYNAKDFGQYAMKDGRMLGSFPDQQRYYRRQLRESGDEQKGQLIGTAFDGNWESMSSDIIFEPSLQRCINVDIRYTLFIMDKFGGAGYLLNEMKITNR